MNSQRHSRTAYPTIFRTMIWGLPLLYLFSSCSDGELGPKQYREYVGSAKSGLAQKSKVGEFEYELQYLPPAFMALRDLGPANGIDSAQFATALRDYEGHHHFLVKVKPLGGKPLREALKAASGDEDEKKAMVHLSFGLQPGFYGLVGNDSLHCSFYHLQPTGQVGDELHYIVALAIPDGQATPLFEKDLVFCFQDTILKLGKVSIALSKTKLNDIPKLIL